MTYVALVERVTHSGMVSYETERYGESGGPLKGHLSQYHPPEDN